MYGLALCRYEGWQVTEFKSPTVISDGTVSGREHTFFEDNAVSIYTNNNEWLRYASKMHRCCGALQTALLALPVC